MSLQSRDDGNERDDERDDGIAARICVVDDDAAVRHGALNLLEAGGYRATGFDSAEAFLAWPGRAEFDLALFDIELPGMDGFALQERCAALGLNMPLLFISGRDDPDMAQRALCAGALALLRKPVDPDLLFDHIERALGLHGSIT
jgi:FixJ family two-component response regulator